MRHVNRDKHLLQVFSHFTQKKNKPLNLFCRRLIFLICLSLVSCRHVWSCFLLQRTAGGNDSAVTRWWTPDGNTVLLFILLLELLVYFSRKVFFCGNNHSNAAFVWHVSHFLPFFFFFFRTKLISSDECLQDTLVPGQSGRSNAFSPEQLKIKELNIHKNYS